MYCSPKLAAFQHEAVSLFQYKCIKAERKKDSSIKLLSVETQTWFVKVLAFSVTVIESYKMKSSNRKFHVNGRQTFPINFLMESKSRLF